jgi:hypothetical protein
MARGKTLGELVNDLRITARMDPNPALSINMVPLLKLTLNREQERLYDDFDWPFMRIRRDVTLQAGQRYYDIPADLNLERIEKVEYLYGSEWRDLTRGIGQEQYSSIDSDNGERSDPTLRWDVLDTGTREQVEFWPIPLTDDQIVRFTGIGKLGTMVNDADRALLDDQMLVNFAAAEIVKDDRLASELRAKAVTRFNTLKGRVTQTRTNTFGLGTGAPDDCHEAPRISVAYVRTP